MGSIFPISLTNSNSDILTVNNNDELEDAINTAVSNCSSVSTPSSLEDVLTTGTWYVSLYYGDHYEQTSQYDGYNFTFNANGTSITVKNTTAINGNWDFHDDVSPKRLDLHFDGSQLHDLATNWNVQEFTSNFIRLRKSEGESGSEEGYYLSFKKN